MSNLFLAKTCELHVHIGGCLSAEHLLELGREHYKNIDWTLYKSSYQKAFGYIPDPCQYFSQAIADKNPRALEPFYTIDKKDAGDFNRFQAKYDFGLCIFRYWWHTLGRVNELLDRIFQQHQNEGIRYIEYRALAPHGEGASKDLVDFHETIANAIRDVCNKNFQARYIISLPRNSSLACYNIIKQWLDLKPNLRPYIVGFDFCHFEEGFPPAQLRDFFSQLYADNTNDPENYFGVTYHVGEMFFDKSLESSIRWCHEVVELGATRLGHCIALGLDPEVSINRKPNAHLFESVSERIAQIQYDLKYNEQLKDWGIEINLYELEKELKTLKKLSKNKRIKRIYSKDRLTEIRMRQNFVLFQLKKSNVVIEVCPTSNLLLGCIPDPSVHPIHRFMESGVSVTIGSDDPGLFGRSLSEEIDWVVRHLKISNSQLNRHLQNPVDFRFSKRRNKSPFGK